jgi:hypothetical protein
MSGGIGVLATSEPLTQVTDLCHNKFPGLQEVGNTHNHDVIPTVCGLQAAKGDQGINLLFQWHAAGSSANRQSQDRQLNNNAH